MKCKKQKFFDNSIQEEIIKKSNERTVTIRIPQKIL